MLSVVYTEMGVQCPWCPTGNLSLLYTNTPARDEQQSAAYRESQAVLFCRARRLMAAEFGELTQTPLQKVWIPRTSKRLQQRRGCELGICSTKMWVLSPKEDRDLFIKHQASGIGLLMK